MPLTQYAASNGAQITCSHCVCPPIRNPASSMCFASAVPAATFCRCKAASRSRAAILSLMITGVAAVTGAPNSSAIT